MKCNELTEGLNRLTPLTELIQISLEGNKISDFEELRPLAGFKDLLCVDLAGNPISADENYAKTVFVMLPWLEGSGE